MLVPGTVTVDAPIQERPQKRREVPCEELPTDERVVVGHRHITAIADEVDRLAIEPFLRTRIGLMTLDHAPSCRKHLGSGSGGTGLTPDPGNPNQDLPTPPP